MTVQEALAQFRSCIRNAHALQHAIGVLSYDAMTAAPPDSAEGRGETLSYLSGLFYEQMTGEAVKEASAVLREHKEELTDLQRREIEIFDRGNEFLSAIPAEEYIAYTALLNEADAVWHRAKADSDYASFCPLVQKIFDTNRRFAGYYRPEMDPYDVQLDQYEKGLTKERTDAFFAALRERIVPLLHRVMERPQVDDSFVKGCFPLEKQRAFSDWLMQVETIDRARCSIGETEHPFTTGFNKKDVRITTHYHEDEVLDSMFSVIHEGGHALYELHSGDELEGTLLSGGCSMSMHESQSRLFENLIARSRPFMKVLLPKMKELFPEAMAGVTEEMLYRAVNRAEPSLIRTEADELTYSLHVMIRYEIEKAMFAGEITAEDLPRVWNEKYKEYLGVDVPDDRRGVLQDSHWSCGNVGYFPSYALGSAYGVQILETIKKDVDVDACVGAGDLAPVAAWLEEHLWRYGQTMDPLDLLEKCCGAPFDPTYYTDYLEIKYSEIYGL